MTQDFKSRAGISLIVSTLLETEQELVESAALNLTSNLSLSQVGVLGTHNVGKSSIIHKLVCYGARKNQTERGDIVWANSLNFKEESSYDTDQSYDGIVRIIKTSDLILQVFDIDATVRRSDIQLLLLIQNFEKPYIAVVNKIDLYRGVKREKLLSRMQSVLKRDLVYVSAKTGEGFNTLIMGIYSLLPEELQVNAAMNLIDLHDRIILERLKIKRRVACEKIIREKSLDAAKIGASRDSSGAQILALHAVMINSIAEQFADVIPNAQIAPITFDTKTTFLLNTLTQSIKDFIPKGSNAITSAHAMIWTTNIGHLAVEYFDQQLDEDSVFSHVKKLIAKSYKEV